jgi:hypothetical protein
METQTGLLNIRLAELLKFHLPKTEKLEKRLESCLDKLSTWKGQEKLWGGQRIDASEIQEKVLQIGIPNASMTPEQAAVFEKIGKEALAKGIRLKVTAIE